MTKWLFFDIGRLHFTICIHKHMIKAQAKKYRYQGLDTHSLILPHLQIVISTEKP